MVKRKVSRIVLVPVRFSNIILVRVRGAGAFLFYFLDAGAGARAVFLIIFGCECGFFQSFFMGPWCGCGFFQDS